MPDTPKATAGIDVHQTEPAAGLPDAANGSMRWIAVSERHPPATRDVIVYGIQRGRNKNRTVHVEYVGTRPWESVEDGEITHWMPLPPAPSTQTQSLQPDQGKQG